MLLYIINVTSITVASVSWYLPHGEMLLTSYVSSPERVFEIPNQMTRLHSNTCYLEVKGNVISEPQYVLL